MTQPATRAFAVCRLGFDHDRAVWTHHNQAGARGFRGSDRTLKVALSKEDAALAHDFRFPRSAAITASICSTKSSAEPFDLR